MVPSEESFPIGFKPHIADRQCRAHWLILYPTSFSWKQIKSLTEKKKIATLNLHPDPPSLQWKDFLTSSARRSNISPVASGRRVGGNISCSLSPFFPQFANPISCLLRIALLLAVCRTVEGTIWKVSESHLAEVGWLFIAFKGRRSAVSARRIKWVNERQRRSPFRLMGFTLSNQVMWMHYREFTLRGANYPISTNRNCTKVSREKTRGERLQLSHAY